MRWLLFSLRTLWLLFAGIGLKYLFGGHSLPFRNIAFGSISPNKVICFRNRSVPSHPQHRQPPTILHHQSSGRGGLYFYDKSYTFWRRCPFYCFFVRVDIFAPPAPCSTIFLAIHSTEIKNHSRNLIRASHAIF